MCLINQVYAQDACHFEIFETEDVVLENITIHEFKLEESFRRVKYADADPYTRYDHDIEVKFSHPKTPYINILKLGSSIGFDSVISMENTDPETRFLYGYAQLSFSHDRRVDMSGADKNKSLWSSASDWVSSIFEDNTTPKLLLTYSDKNSTGQEIELSVPWVAIPRAPHNRIVYAESSAALNGDGVAIYLSFIAALFGFDAQELLNSYLGQNNLGNNKSTDEYTLRWGGALADYGDISGLMTGYKNNKYIMDSANFINFNKYWEKAKKGACK